MNAMSEPRFARMFAAGAAGLALGVAASADTIGVDDRTSVYDNFASGASFSEWRAVVAGLGHTIVPLTSFTLADLAGLDALVVLQPFVTPYSFSAAEVAAIPAFVAGGGGLWMIGEGGIETGASLSNFNQVASALGVTYTTNLFDGSGLAVSGFVAHEVTSGVVSYGVDYHRAMSAVAPALDLTVSGGNQNVLCVRDGTGGAGNVAFTGDTNCWENAGSPNDYDIASLSNRILLENIVTYIVGVAPLSAAPPTLSLSAGGVQDMTIDVGADYAGDFYLVLGSLSGTQPGFVYETFQVPLNADVYFAQTLTSPNAQPLSQQFGVLDANGIGLTRFTLPAGTQPALAGTVVDHAAFVIDSGPIPLLTVVTNPVALTLTP